MYIKSNAVGMIFSTVIEGLRISYCVKQLRSKMKYILICAWDDVCGGHSLVFFGTNGKYVVIN